MKPLATTTRGQGESLVLIHGWGMHSEIWREFAGQLGQHYQVICIDLPGHGKSTLKGPFTLQNISQQVIASVPDAPCYWLGWSLGGAVVLDIAKRYPQKVVALVLLAANPHFLASNDWPGMDKLEFEQFCNNVALQGDAAVLNFLLLQLSVMPNPRAELKILKQRIETCPMPKVETLLGGLEILANEDLRANLQGCQLPVQVILGADDNLVPVAAGEAMSACQPKAQIHVIAQAGHMPFLSHVQQTVAAITTFIDGIKYAGSV